MKPIMAAIGGISIILKDSPNEKVLDLVVALNSVLE